MPIIVFGDEGNDTIYGGTGDDMIFGDRGRVNFEDEGGAIVTRLGFYPEVIKGFVQSIAGTTVTATASIFPTDDEGLAGQYVRIINGTGFGQRRLILSNDADEFVVDEAWDIEPDNTSEFRISTMPEDQTDGVRRGAKLMLSVDPGVGGSDLIYGNSGDDTIFGGAAGDAIFGEWDAADGDDPAGTGNDLIFGDSGRLDFSLADSSIDPGFGESAPTLLDHVYSTHLGIGGADTISGSAGADTIFGGAAGDTIFGDGATASTQADLVDVILGDSGEIVLDAGVVAEIRTTDTTEGTGGADAISGDDDADIILGGVNGSADTLWGNAGNDILLGDNGELYWNDDADLATLDRVRTVDTDRGAGDTIYGNAGDDTLFGGTGGDWMEGNENDDLAFGDYGILLLAGGVAVDVQTTDRTLGGTDTMGGGLHEDILIGGANADVIDGDAGDDLIFGDNVRLARLSGFGDTTNERFRALAGTLIYDMQGADNVEMGARYANPDNVPVWVDWNITLLDHDTATESAGQNNFGNDYIAGGADDDTIFAQLGNDVVQGDGAIEGKLGGSPVDAYRAGDGTLFVAPSFEAASDGDDYIEGNGGDDVIFGNLGQDDIIGGSSDLFSLDDAGQAAGRLRPDLRRRGHGHRPQRRWATMTRRGPCPRCRHDPRRQRQYLPPGGDQRDRQRRLPTFNYDDYSASLRIVAARGRTARLHAGRSRRRRGQLRRPTSARPTRSTANRATTSSTA